MTRINEKRDPYSVKFQNANNKENILRAAHRIGQEKLIDQGTTTTLVPDLSPETLDSGQKQRVKAFEPLSSSEVTK